MGFGGSRSWENGDSFRSDSYEIGLDEVRCSYTNWDSCTYQTSHDCSRSENVLLTCIGKAMFWNPSLSDLDRITLCKVWIKSIMLLIL